MGAYMARKLRVKWIGLGGIVRHMFGKDKGGYLDTKAYNAFPYIGDNSLYFLPCGAKLMSLVCGRCGNAWSI